VHADAWTIDTSGKSGVIVQKNVSNASDTKKIVFVVFEYERGCEPIISYAEFEGNYLFNPYKKYLFNNPNLGLVIDGYYYRSNSAKIDYRNGFEVGLMITKSLWNLLLNSNDLIYIKPNGNRINLETTGLSEKLIYAASF
jgi:hypothetical protein